MKVGKSYQEPLVALKTSSSLTAAKLDKDCSPEEHSFEERSSERTSGVKRLHREKKKNDGKNDNMTDRNGHETDLKSGGKNDEVENNRKRSKKQKEEKKHRTGKEKDREKDKVKKRKKRKDEKSDKLETNCSDHIAIDYAERKEVSSESDWSSDDEGNHEKEKGKKNNQLSNNKSQSKMGFRDVLFLPDGNVMMSEERKGGSEFGTFFQDRPIDWILDKKSDPDIVALGYYKPDISVYSLYTGDINYEYSNNYDITNSNTGTNDNEMISNNNDNNLHNFKRQNKSTYASSFSLAKKMHTLPSGAIFMPKNVPLFRPKENLMMNEKTRILKEIRLKKKNRFFIACRCVLEKSESNHQEKSKKQNTIDVLSDISVKRIRMDILRKQKKEQALNNQKKQTGIIDVSTEKKENVDECDSVVLYSGSSYLNSDYLPLPIYARNEIDREFVNENEELKSVKTVETKINRAAFFGFGKSATENDNNDISKKQKVEVAADLDIKKVQKVFLSDAEVRYRRNKMYRCKDN